MFPSVEGMRNAADVLHRLGALPAPVAPADVVDLLPVAALEQEWLLRSTDGTTWPRLTSTM